MSNVHKIAAAADADAVYILGRIAEADNAEAEAHQNEEQAATLRQNVYAYRLDAGKRLIAVRARMLSDKGLSERSTKSPFAKWLRDNAIDDSTASRLMRDAGFTEEQRTEHNAKERDRKRTERAKAKPRAPTLIQRMVARYGLAINALQAHGDRDCLRKDWEAAFGPGFNAQAPEAEDDAYAAALQIALLRAPGERVVVEIAPTELSQSAAAKAQREATRLAAQIINAERAVIAEEQRVAKEASSAAYFRRVKEEERIEEMRKKLGVTFLTKDDVRFLVGFTHPDKHPGNAERAGRAYSLMQQLEQALFPRNNLRG